MGIVGAHCQRDGGDDPTFRAGNWAARPYREARVEQLRSIKQIQERKVSGLRLRLFFLCSIPLPEPERNSFYFNLNRNKFL